MQRLFRLQVEDLFCYLVEQVRAPDVELDKVVRRDYQRCGNGRT